MIKRTLLLLSILCLCLQGFAQQFWLIEPKNTIKWNVPALAAHNFSLQYERVLNEKTSLALGLNLMPGGRVPLAQSIRSYYLGEASNKNVDAAEDFASKGELSGWSVTPEFRYYFGKHSHQGFYLVPYLRYAQYTFKWDYTFDDEGVQRPTDFTGKLSVAGGGLMAGYQWHFGKIVLDYWILGLSYNANSLSLEARTDLRDKTDADKKDLKHDIEDLKVNGRGLKATVTNHGATARGNAGLPGIRMGLCIGYRF